jgi:hypothetical protein
MWLTFFKKRTDCTHSRAPNPSEARHCNLVQIRTLVLDELLAQKRDGLIITYFRKWDARPPALVEIAV